jgi:hypothetical protein
VFHVHLTLSEHFNRRVSDMAIGGTGILREENRLFESGAMASV